MYSAFDDWVFATAHYTKAQAGTQGQTGTGGVRHRESLKILVYC